MEKALGKFGIVDISVLKFVSDRGANFVKALKDYTSHFCFAHRLNNILVSCFYQNEAVKFQSGCSDFEDENVFSSKDLLDCSLLTDGTDEMAFVEASKLNVKNLPSYVREVLKTLNNCKDIVKYTKLVS